MCAKKVYVVTGGNRGLGFAIAKSLSQDSDNIVIATSRNPDKATELIDLQSKKSNVHAVKLDVTSKESALAAAEDVKKITGGVVDVLIANAGIAAARNPVSKEDPKNYEEHWRTNFLGSLHTYQAFYPLLKRSSVKKIFFISTMAGSISSYFPTTLSAYGASKAGLNFLTRAIAADLQADGFCVVAIHPGLVKSDMGNRALEFMNKYTPQFAASIETFTPDEAATHILATIDSLTPEDTSSFLGCKGEKIPW